MDGPLTAAILIVSTTAAKDPSTDASSEILTSVFKAQGDGKWEVIETAIASDNFIDIQRQIKTWVDHRVNFVVTTGGTGFASSDLTPEVAIKILSSRQMLNID